MQDLLLEQQSGLELLAKLQAADLKIADTHLHLTVLNSLQQQQYLNYCQQWQVLQNWIVTTHQTDQERLLEQAGDLQQLNPAVQLIKGIGTHPQALADLELDLSLRFQKQSLADPQVKWDFIGEIGLDGLHIFADFAWQQKVFTEQLKLAADYNLAVNIHAVAAIAPSQQLIAQLLSQGYQLRGIAHAFNGNLTQALQWIDLGFKIGIGPLTLQSNSLCKLVQQLPVEHLVLETDLPYIAKLELDLPHPLIRSLVRLQSFDLDPLEIVAASWNNSQDLLLK